MTGFAYCADLDFGRRGQAHDLVGRHVLDQAHIASPQCTHGRLAARQTDLANALDRRIFWETAAGGADLRGTAGLRRLSREASTPASFAAATAAAGFCAGDALVGGSGRRAAAARRDRSSDHAHRKRPSVTSGRSRPVEVTRPSNPAWAGPTGPSSQDPPLSGE